MEFTIDSKMTKQDLAAIRDQLSGFENSPLGKFFRANFERLWRESLDALQSDITAGAIHNAAEANGELGVLQMLVPVTNASAGAFFLGPLYDQLDARIKEIDNAHP